MPRATNTSHHSVTYILIASFTYVQVICHSSGAPPKCIEWNWMDDFLVHLLHAFGQRNAKVLGDLYSPEFAVNIDYSIHVWCGNCCDLNSTWWIAQKLKPLQPERKRDFLQLSYGALKRVMSWRLAKNSYPSSTTFAKEYAKSIMQESLGAGLELLQFLLAWWARQTRSISCFLWWGVTMFGNKLKAQGSTKFLAHRSAAEHLQKCWDDIRSENEGNTTVVLRPASNVLATLGNAARQSAKHVRYEAPCPGLPTGDRKWDQYQARQ